jgi:two-component system OmpR family sensor kinase
MSIRQKLTFWYAGIFAVLFLLFGIGLYFYSSYLLYNDERDELRKYGETVNSEIRLVDFFGFYRIQLPDLDSFQSSSTFLQAINASGGEVTRSSNLRGRSISFDEHALQRMKGEARGYYQMVDQGEYSFLVYYQPLVFDGSLVGVVQVARIANHIERFLQNLQLILLLSGVLLTGLTVTVGWFLARQTLQPIEVITAATKRIQNSEDLNSKIIYDGPADEIGRLTDTINGMFTRIRQSYLELDESIRAQHRFVADASHELRTPLTTIRGNVDLLRKMMTQSSVLSVEEQQTLTADALGDIAEEAERMTRLIHDMLLLARSDAGVEVIMEPIQLLPIIEETIRKVQFLPRNVDWQVPDLSPLEDLVVRGNADYLQQLFTIFIENAFKYTLEGYVSLDVQLKDDAVGIRIRDSGIGLDAEQVPFIFERFYRADPSRGLTAGTGLGLSIARWIIDEHHGSIEVMSTKGEGTTFIIWLPLYLAPAN